MEVLPTGEVVRAPEGRDPREAVAPAARAEENRREFERSRLAMMRAYAELRDSCRRAFVLNYFGEPFEGRCGNCDICEAGAASEGEVARPFAVGSRVIHAAWGGGLVQRYDGDQMIVLFDTVGYKTLGVSLVHERALLEAEV